MDGNQFDSLTRSLAERPTRRRVLSAMLGAVTAGLAGAAGRGVDAAGRCRTVGQACKTTADCCPFENNAVCAGTGKKKACQACATGTTVCAGSCVDTTSNSSHCGGCGKVCAGGSSCVNNECRCPAGQQRDASGTCVCAGTFCPNGHADCCEGFACNDQTGRCEACRPAGATSPDNELCCSTASFGDVCVNLCTTDGECQAGTGQVCVFLGGPQGICGCPGGLTIAPGGACV